ncbi:MAG: hypothetical protein JWM16_1774 [Verrucomicrobiales bacterium]|nr:hypothetical protein [Verrucomicrobiales bacterium]
MKKRVDGSSFVLGFRETLRKAAFVGVFAMASYVAPSVMHGEDFDSRLVEYLRLPYKFPCDPSTEQTEIAVDELYTNDQTNISKALERLLAHWKRIESGEQYSLENEAQTFSEIASLVAGSGKVYRNAFREVRQGVLYRYDSKNLPTGEFGKTNDYQWTNGAWYTVNAIRLQDPATNGFFNVEIQPRARHAYLTDKPGLMATDMEIYRNAMTLPGNFLAMSASYTVDRAAARRAKIVKAFKSSSQLPPISPQRFQEALDGTGRFQVALQPFGHEKDLSQFVWLDRTKRAIDRFQLVCVEGSPSKPVYGYVMDDKKGLKTVAWWVREKASQTPRFFFWMGHKPNGQAELHMQEVHYAAIAKSNPEEFRFDPDPKKWSYFYDKRPEKPLFFINGVAEAITLPPSQKKFPIAFFLLLIAMLLSIAVVWSRVRKWH